MSVENFLSHIAERFFWGGGGSRLRCVSDFFWQRKRFGKGGRGVSRFSVEIFSSPSTEKLPVRFVSQYRKTVLCFKKNLVWKIFTHRRGGIIVLPKVLLSDSTKNFRRGIFLCCVSENFREPKGVTDKGGGSIRSFRRKLFVSHCR